MHIPEILNFVSLPKNMLDSLFEERLERNEFLPIGDSGNHLLVETSYMNPRSAWTT